MLLLLRSCWSRAALEGTHCPNWIWHRVVPEANRTSACHPLEPRILLNLLSNNPQPSACVLLSLLHSLLALQRFLPCWICVCSWQADSVAGHSGPAPLSSDSSCFCLLALKEDRRDVGVQTLRSGAAQRPGPVLEDGGLTLSHSSAFFGWDVPLGQRWPHASLATFCLCTAHFSVQGPSQHCPDFIYTTTLWAPRMSVVGLHVLGPEHHTSHP